MRTKLFSKLTRERLRPFVEEHASDVRTLDIGCANAPYGNLFTDRVGFDFVNGPGVDVVGDAHELPFGDGEFKQILCTEVLEHLHTPQRALDEMCRVLEPGGVLILTTRFVFPLHDTPHDYFRYTIYGLKHLLREWESVVITKEASTVVTLGVLLQRIAFQCDLRGGRVTKIFVLLLARIVCRLSWVVRREYGTRKASGATEEDAILTSGYYVVARKKA